MPVYEYQCEECGVRFECLQPMSADHVSSCPECGGNAHRAISPVGVIFKGSGFYVTDNRKSGSGRSRSSTAGESHTESTKGEESTQGESSKEPASESTSE